MYTAGANETAIVDVVGNAYMPTGVHALGVFPMYSTNGTTWANASGGYQTIAGHGAASSQWVNATSHAVLNLTSGTTYYFATGVWD